MDKREYEKLKLFLQFFADNFMNAIIIPLEERPFAVLTNLERKSKSTARKALEMGIGDCVIQTDSWSKEKILAVDKELRLLGLDSLTEIRVKYSKKIGRIISQGRIISDKEYFLIKNVVDSNGNLDGTEEQKQMQMLLSDYELLCGGRQFSEK